jgi:hypothetical protein
MSRLEIQTARVVGKVSACVKILNIIIIKYKNKKKTNF